MLKSPAFFPTSQVVPRFTALLHGSEVLDLLFREARKFGLGMALASQLANDFGPALRANAGTIFTLRANSAQEVQRNAKELGINPNLVAKLSRPGQAIVRDASGIRGVQIERWPFRRAAAVSVQTEPAQPKPSKAKRKAAETFDPDELSIGRQIELEHTKSPKVAERIEDYRGAHLYNRLDANYRRFAAEVPQVTLWDDHEVVDNWTWEKRLDADPRYKIKDARSLATFSERAFREYMPLADGLDGPMRLYRRFSFGPHLDLFRLDMRSFRGPNTVDVSNTAYLGNDQLAWLKQALKSSKATWKIVAADMPLGLVVYDDWRTKTGADGLANADDGPPFGRELEIASLLAFIKHEDIRNVHWITADVHYPATHRYDPARAAFSDFTPFYEFVSGPLCAGGFGPNALDRTFGPQIVFQKTPSRIDLSPLEGSCHFGHVKIDGRTGLMTVTHRDAKGEALYRLDLAPV